MVLQTLVEVGHVKITDYMIDANNVVIKVRRRPWQQRGALYVKETHHVLVRSSAAVLTDGVAWRQQESA